MTPRSREARNRATCEGAAGPLPHIRTTNNLGAMTQAEYALREGFRFRLKEVHLLFVGSFYRNRRVARKKRTDLGRRPLVI